MYIYEALSLIRASTKTILIDSGFVDGSLLTNEQIKSQTEPIFWETNVNNKEASDKEKYIIFSIVECTGSVYADGTVWKRRGTIRLSIVSRSRNIDSLVQMVNLAFVEKGWGFEFSNMFYDEANKMYVSEFLCGAQLWNLD